MLEKIIETVEFLKTKGIKDPEAGIILGTGLGGLTEKIEKETKNRPIHPARIICIFISISNFFVL